MLGSFVMVLFFAGRCEGPLAKDLRLGSTGDIGLYFLGEGTDEVKGMG